MLIVGINGSPKKEGNTAFLVREGLAAAAAAELERLPWDVRSGHADRGIADFAPAP